jgi:hypothetical protein
MFLWNVGWLSTNYTALYPRRQDSLQKDFLTDLHRKLYLAIIKISNISLTIAVELLEMGECRCEAFTISWYPDDCPSSSLKCLHLSRRENPVTLPPFTHITANSWKHYLTDWCSGHSLNLYSGGAYFESRPGHRYPNWSFLLFSSVPPPRLGHDHFLPNHFQLIVYQSF